MKELKITLSGHHNCPRCEATDVDLYMVTGHYIIRDVCGRCVEVVTGRVVDNKLDVSTSTKYNQALELLNSYGDSMAIKKLERYLDNSDMEMRVLLDILREASRRRGTVLSRDIDLFQRNLDIFRKLVSLLLKGRKI